MKTIHSLSLLFVATAITACAATTGTKNDPSTDEGATETTSTDLEPLETPVAPEIEHGPIVEDPPSPPFVAHETNALASAPPFAPKLLPTELDDLPVTDVVSAPPKEKEWIETTARATTNPSCHAKLVREWMKITCAVGTLYMSDPIATVRVLFGDATQLSVTGYIPPSANGGYNTWAESYATAILPLRRRDRRIFELTFLQGGTKLEFAHPTVFTISEVWLEGMKSPEITVTR
jgi:hypothetical protein